MLAVILAGQFSQVVKRDIMAVKTMDFIDYGSVGTCTSFGDLTNEQEQLAGCADATRGILGGGRISSVNTAILEYITMASTGNASSFGDLTEARRGVAGVQG